MMRFLVLTISFVYSLVCLPQQIKDEIYSFSEDGTDILVKNKYIIQPVLEGYTDVTPYTSVGNITFNMDYRIEFLNYKGWETEAGAYRIVRVYHGEDELIEVIDEDAWIHTPSEYQSHSLTATNNEALLFSLGNNTTAVVLIGYTYASQAPKLTIIVMKGNEAKVVFNQSWIIKKFTAYPKGFELTVVAEYLEHNSNGNPCFETWRPNTHKLYTTDKGTMMFEKTNE